jgi:hypothetical protein
MKFWWVNHSQTFDEEVGSGFLWSPKTTQVGKSHFYDNMTRLQPGDIVFSYADTQIRAIGMVLSQHETAPKPFSQKGANWSDEGWHVPVLFHALDVPLKPKDYIEIIRPTLPEKYSPINAEGNGNQGAYLSEVPISMVEVLLGLLNPQFDIALSLLGGNLREFDDAANIAESKIEMRTDIPVTQIKQLVKARRGQGIFKTNVKLVEKACRVTGLELHQHLIASHIKPWADSTDQEKLDGYNGLLLSPHIDHLFDRGYLSFENNGQLIVSQKLQYRVLSTWHIDPDKNVGAFSTEQAEYLEYHRDVRLLAA